MRLQKSGNNGSEMNGNDVHGRIPVANAKNSTDDVLLSLLFFAKETVDVSIRMFTMEEHPKSFACF